MERFPDIKGKEQVGEETFYPKRGPKDSELDVTKNIAEQFDLLRVFNNERYPAHFTYRNQKYIIKVYKDDDQ